MTRLLGGLVLFLLLSSGLVAGEFTISLRAASSSSSGQRITIGDIADISGGTMAQRNQISKLDLETLDPSSPGCRLTKRQVEFRILVDGYRRSEFQVTGPDEVSVRCRLPREFRGKLERLFQAEIARQFGVEQNIIAVRLVDELQIEATESKLQTANFSASVMLPSQLPVGKTLVQVEFEESNGHRFLEKFDTQVILSRDVVVATKKIPRGAIVDETMFRVIKRPILRKDDFVEPDGVIGRVAQRDISSNEVVLSSYLAEARASRTAVIQRNDLIDVIIKLGRSEIRLKNAKALRSGDVGETISVLNTQSNRQLGATVVSRNLAIVPQVLRGSR